MADPLIELGLQIVSHFFEWTPLVAELREANAMRQKNKAGAPYILHPLRMMLQMKSVETQMAAVLHDVVEDCSVTPALLAYEGFPASVIEAVCIDEADHQGVEEPYEDFIRRAAQNPIARLVKLADLEDNMDRFCWYGSAVLVRRSHA